MFSPKYSFSDQDLLELLTEGGDAAYGRFVVNELSARSSDLVLRNRDLFMSSSVTRASFYNSIGDWPSLADTVNDLQADDLVRIMDANLILGRGIDIYLDLFESNLELLRMSSGFCAKLLKYSGTGEFADFAHDAAYLDSRPTSPAMNLIGITKAKNEGALPVLGVNHLLDYCDHVVISDASDVSLASEHFSDPKRVTVIRQPQPIDETIIYEQLYREARTRRATHVLHMDVDERISSELTPEELRRAARRLKVGETIAVPWDQVIDLDGKLRVIDFESAFGKYTFSRLLPPYKDLVFCDDGVSNHRKMKLHCPSIPSNFPTRRYFSAGSLLHLEGISTKNFFSKSNRYFNYDFGINGNFNLSMSRYLPNYFRNLRILEDGFAERFTRELELTTAAEYVKEFDSRKISVLPKIDDEEQDFEALKAARSFERFYFVEQRGC